MSDDRPDPSFWGEDERRRWEHQMARARAKARLRRQRTIALLVLVAACIALAAALWTLHQRSERPTPVTTPVSAASVRPSPTATHVAVVTTASPRPSPSTSRTHSTSTTPAPVAKPAIVEDFIPFGAKRRAEMVAYSLRHYGQATIVLHPLVIVLHFTDGPTYGSAHALFSEDVPNTGELPGTVSHFIIDKDGTIYQQLPLDIRGRHAIGLNWCAIGIEFVQEGGSSATWADQQILHRSAQLDAGLRLVAWLQQQYHISDSNVIGHAMANDSPYFKDLEGWRNDHSDWQPADVAQFIADLQAQRG
jgi:hypothetical protein